MREVLFLSPIKLFNSPVGPSLKELAATFVLVEHCSQASTCSRTQPDPETVAPYEGEESFREI